MKRVVQISDTHLSPSKRHFAANWEPLARWIRAQAPDYVIHTGDVTVDGADIDEDLAHCAALFRELDVPVLAVPGNHDVGDPTSAFQPASEARVAAWRRHFGPDWWSLDLEGWRVIGLDSMLIGSGLALESEQGEWLDAQMQSAHERSLAWFLHRPLFLEVPEEGDSGYWAIAPSLRARLFARARERNVSLVGSGHLHQMNERVHQGCRYVFCPSSAYVVGDKLQEEMPGDKRLGAVVYEFDGRNVRVRLEELPELSRFWIDDVIHEVYPPRRAG